MKRVVFLGALVLIGSCITVPDPYAPFVGTYTLASIDGRQVPAYILRAKVMSSSITLKPNGKFERVVKDSLIGVDGGPYVVSNVESGTWEADAATQAIMFFSSGNAPLYAGTVANGELDVQISNQTWEHHR